MKLSSTIRDSVWRLRTSSGRRALVLLLDGALTALGLVTALLVRFEGALSDRYLALLPGFVLVAVACRMTANRLLRLDRWSFRFSGLTDGARLGLAGLLGSGLMLGLIYIARLHGLPRSVVIIELLVSTALMALVRFSPRLAWMYQVDRERSRRNDSQRTLILGAGAAGEMLLRDLQRSREHGYQVLGFIDDDPSRWGTIVGGKPILGGVDHLPELVRRHRIAKVLIAIPRLTADRIREILALSADLKLSFKILPVSFLDMEGRVTTSMLQDLSPEDLLPRDPVHFDHGGADGPIAGRRALVTGGAGSIGSEIAAQLLTAGAGQVVLVDIDENGLYLFKRQLERRFAEAEVEIEVADIREEGRIDRLFDRYRPQDVFHAAAHKHVPLMEAAPGEAVKNNVLGTLHVARAAHRHGAERFVFISTDKAVRPTSVMGASKRIGELLVRALSEGSATRFSAVRFGNVLDSAGSVVPLFRDQIAAGGPVTVTDPEVRRYFMTISEAVGLVLKAAYGDYGALCVLEMGEQIRILDLARHLITMAGLEPEVDVPIVFTGLRPGEKLAEELLTEEEEGSFRVDEKIRLAKSQPPPAGALQRIEALIAAAQVDDEPRLFAELRRLVPTYEPGPGSRCPQAGDNELATREPATREPALAGGAVG